MTDSDEQPYDAGTAGASARREHERRKANREQRVRAKHPHIGRLVLALTDDPRHERSWGDGATGEELVARSLARHLRSGVVVLHDRRIPRSRANIDHIAIASSGVWIIDAKRYKGKVAVSKPLFGSAKLTIAGRDKSKLVDGLSRQVELVRGTVAELGADVPIQGALCFVEADLPVLSKLSFAGFPLLYPKALAKRINADGPVASDRVKALAEQLGVRFPPA